MIKVFIAKRTPESHLAADIPTRGTTVVVGEAMTEASIPTINLPGSLWPDSRADHIVIPSREMVVNLSRIIRRHVAINEKR